MLPPLPRCSGWAYSSLIPPSCISLPRMGYRVGLHIVLFEACSAFTRVAACPLALSPIRDTLIEGFSHFVTSMTAPIASGRSEFAGWALHPLESAALPQRTPNGDIPTPAPNGAPPDLLGGVFVKYAHVAQLASPLGIMIHNNVPVLA